MTNAIVVPSFSCTKAQIIIAAQNFPQRRPQALELSFVNIPSCLLTVVCAISLIIAARVSVELTLGLTAMLLGRRD